MGWEIILNEGRKSAKNKSRGSSVYFPGSKCKVNKNGGRYATLQMLPEIVKEMRWQFGDALLCMVDKESKLLAVTRDKRGPTILSSNGARKRKDGSSSNCFRLSIQRDLSIALQAMWGIEVFDDSVFVDLEHIIDGSMVVFSRRTTNDQT
jgi:hypothetical protein